MSTPLLSKSVVLPLLGLGLLACFVIHPYVGFAVWALAVVVALQELVLLAALPFVALWHWLDRTKT
jgi:hypothetical protein